MTNKKLREALAYERGCRDTWDAVRGCNADLTRSALGAFQLCVKVAKDHLDAASDARAALSSTDSQSVGDDVETRFWSIVDRDGLTGLPSDMWAALEALVSRAARAPKQGDVSAAGHAIQKAWDENGSLPPIDFAVHEREALAIAALSASPTVQSEPSGDDVELGEWRALARATLSAMSIREAGVREALIQHNDRLRSAMQIANRNGADTNWLAFRGQCQYTLAEFHDIVNDARAALKAGGDQ